MINKNGVNSVQNNDALNYADCAILPLKKLLW
jgi:hypothetical protein